MFVLAMTSGRHLFRIVPYQEALAHLTDRKPIDSRAEGDQSDPVRNVSGVMTCTCTMVPVPSILIAVFDKSPRICGNAG